MAERYVPAAGRPALTRFYDTIAALTMRETTFRGRLRTTWGSLELLSALRAG